MTAPEWHTEAARALRAGEDTAWTRVRGVWVRDEDMPDPSDLGEM